MKYIAFILFLLFQTFQSKAQTYSAKEIYVHFFSSAPIADIEAITNTATTTLNIEKKEVEIELKVSNFKFKKALMQAHFNEKYIESEKYPNSTFKGKFKEVINLEKDGVYTINLEGRFSIHGIERPKTLNCVITVKDHKITFQTAFKLLSADYKIKAPDVLYRKVGQEVSVDANGILVRDK
jgi:polyisoprenoid-binding protein YceI